MNRRALFNSGAPGESSNVQSSATFELRSFYRGLERSNRGRFGTPERAARAYKFNPGPLLHFGGGRLRTPGPFLDSGASAAWNRHGSAIIEAPTSGEHTRPGHPRTPVTDPPQTAPHTVILFDGVCNLCSASVQWIIERDTTATFRFASLQSEAGTALLATHGVTLNANADPDSVILVDHEGVHEHSDAALRIAHGLGRPWSLAWSLRFVPRFVRDGLYRWVARNRYRWFGRKDACWLPTPDLRARFLDQGA